MSKIANVFTITLISYRNYIKIKVVVEFKIKFLQQYLTLKKGSIMICCAPDFEKLMKIIKRAN